MRVPVVAAASFAVAATVVGIVVVATGTGCQGDVGAGEGEGEGANRGLGEHCTEDGDCGARLACVPFVGKCEPDECDFDDDCPRGETCGSGCAGIVCEQPKDVGEACSIEREDNCSDSHECRSGLDCTLVAFQGINSTSLCTGRCDVHGDCPAGQACASVCGGTPACWALGQLDEPCDACGDGQQLPCAKGLTCNGFTCTP